MGREKGERERSACGFCLILEAGGQRPRPACAFERCAFASRAPSVPYPCFLCCVCCVFGKGEEEGARALISRLPASSRVNKAERQPARRLFLAYVTRKACRYRLAIITKETRSRAEACWRFFVDREIYATKSRDEEAIESRTLSSSSLLLLSVLVCGRSSCAACLKRTIQQSWDLRPAAATA